MADATTKAAPAADDTPQPLTPALPMSVGFKIGEVQRAIHMISTDTDSDSTMRIAALKRVAVYCESEIEKINADSQADVDAALNNV